MHLIYVDRKDHAIPLFVKAKTLPVTFLYYEAVCNLMFNIHNNNAPTNIIHEIIYQNFEDSYASTRSSTSQHYYVKNSRLNVLKNAFSRVGVKTWNEIPYELKSYQKNRLRKN